MADPRSEHNHRGDSFPGQLSLDFSCLSLDDWGDLNHSLGDVTPTRSSYAHPFTVATPVSEWSDCGSEISRTSRGYDLEDDGAQRGARFESAGRVALDNPTDDWSSSSWNSVSFVESEFSFQSDTATVRAAPDSQSQYSSRSQASATSWRN
jgi:hypothetical protein